MARSVSAPKHSVGVRSRAPGSINAVRLPPTKGGGSHGGNPKATPVPKGTPLAGVKRYVALGQTESRGIAAKRGRSE